MIALLTAPVGAFLYRHRGGFLPTGHTQLARGDFSLGMAALLYLATGDWRFALASVPLWFLGSLAPNGDWMGIADLEQFGEGIVSGVLNVLAVCAAALLFGHWALAACLFVAGGMKGPAYLAGKFWPRWDVPQFHAGPEMGECLFGAALGVAVGVG